MNELYHHGIKGQKWGVRRFQDYSGRLTSAGKERLKDQTSTKKIDDAYDLLDHSKSDKSQLHLFMTRVAFDVVTLNPINLTTDVIRGIYAGKSFIKKKVYDAEKNKEEVDLKTGFHVKSKETTMEQDLKRVNPLYYNFDRNTKSNCMLCTSTYDLRRRGFDVEAKKASFGYKPTDILKWYPNAKINTISGIDERTKKPSNRAMIDNLTKELTSQGEGARGNIMVRWQKCNSGHSMVYEIQNGKLMILDAQVNKTYTNPVQILRRCQNTVTYVRLDNVNFSNEGIKEVAS